MLALSRRLGESPRRSQVTRLAAGFGTLAKTTLAGAVLVGSVTATTGTAQASPAAAPIGGDQLGSTGLVYDQTAGVPAPPAVVAGGWVIVDLDTDQVLAANNAHGTFGPASTLKVLSALVMLPQIEPTRQILAASSDVNVPGSKVGIVPTHTYTADMLFTAMLVVSGNDAARVLASALGGEANVVTMMNAKAADLQANDTVAKTVTGLDAPDQTTSAYDLALISRAALEIPSFQRYIAINKTQFSGLDVPPFAITNHNLLLGHYPGAYGVKNGYTDTARATYVGAARQNGHNLLIAMTRTDPEYRNSAEALLNWGFGAVGKVKPVGTLVSPKSTLIRAAQEAAAGAGGTSALRAGTAAPAHHGLSAFEYGAIGAGTALVVLFFGRRRQVKRRRAYRRTRLRLPDL